MGWADCGTDSKGRPIGYAFEAKCDHPGCDRNIDRGLGYACGDMHGEADESCERYFCEDHVEYRHCPSDGSGHRLCLSCAARLDEAKLEDFKDVLLAFVRPKTDHYSFVILAPRVAVLEHGGSKADVSREVEVYKDGELVGHIERTFFIDERTERWDFHALERTVNVSLGHKGLKTAIDKCRRMLEPPPPTPRRHRAAIYELLLRWDEIDELPIDGRFMTEHEVEHVRRRQRNNDEIKALVAKGAGAE